MSGSTQRSGGYQTVQFVRLRHEIRLVDGPAFALRPDRPLRWVQRICCWILAKLGAFEQEKLTEPRRITIARSSFRDRFADQYRELVGQWNVRPAVILMGSEDYAALMSDPDVLDTPFHFTVTMNEPFYRGLRVQIVPWMRGVLLLPREMLNCA